MYAFKKTFVAGLLAGVALTLVTLQAWGNHLAKTMDSNSNPSLLLPVAYKNPTRLPSFERFKHPWFPESSGRAHDDWSLKALDGTRIKLGDLHGKVVILDFWETSCVPCLAQMAGIERLQNSLKGDQAEFLAVTDEAEGPVREFLRRRDLGIPVYFVEKNLPDDFAFGGYPTTLILDTSGAVVSRSVGALNWDDDNARAFIRRLARQHSIPN